MLKPDLGDESSRLNEPVRITGSARNTGDRVELAGRIEGNVECDCARCLKPVGLELDFSFRDIFVSPESFESTVEAELDAEDMDVSVFEGETLDLAEVVREQILLFLPEQVFCSGDCRGLCPKCGIDLNLKSCDCSQPDIDPRWAGLKDLKG